MVIFFCRSWVDDVRSGVCRVCVIGFIFRKFCRSVVICLDIFGILAVY